MNEQWSIVAGQVPHPVLATGLLLIAAAAIAEAVWSVLHHRRRLTRKVPRERWALLSATVLRVIGVMAILAVGFELSLRIEAVAPLRQRVTVLVDDSASMAIADARSPQSTATPRHERAATLYRSAQSTVTEWSARGLDVDLRRFSAGPPNRVRDVDSLWSEPPRGDASDLAIAVQSLAEDPPGAVVLISDGLVARDATERSHVLESAVAMGVPITAVDVGAPHLVDVSIAALRCGEFAFVENVVTFEVDIEAHGLAGRATTVDLLRDGETVASEPITLGDDGSRQTVRFERAPDRVGQFVYEFRIPNEVGEATFDNNRQAFVVNVLRDKVRVLHVAGRPNWDVRALRTLLKRDPNVELLSYYILRDWEDSEREDRTAELSLIAFPTDELFYEQLGSFDLLVLHNFDAVRYGAYLDNIATYVREGGALVVIGGDLGLATGDYAAPQLASLLPVDTRRPAALDRSPYRPRLTDEGRRHPITAWIGRAPGEWEGLPELDDFSDTGPAREGASIHATTLLAHPQLKSRDGSPSPLLAVAEPSKGRTMVLATGASWRLGFAPDLQLIDGSRPFDLLWLSAVRWLLRDASSERLILDLDRTTYRADDPISLSVRTLGPSYGPQAEVAVDWEVRPLVHEGGDDEARRRHGAWTTDASGRAQTTLHNLPVGAYEVVAHRGESDDTQKERARRVFLIESPVRELAAIDSDPGASLLRELSSKTNGAYVSAIDGDTLPGRLELASPTDAQRRGRIEARHERPLWSLGDGWLALAILIATLAGEWLLRRRYGLA